MPLMMNYPGNYKTLKWKTRHILVSTKNRYGHKIPKNHPPTKKKREEKAVAIRTLRKEKGSLAARRKARAEGIKRVRSAHAEYYDRA